MRINMKKAFLIHFDGYYDTRLKHVEEKLIEEGLEVELLFSNFNHFTKSTKNYSNKNVRAINVPSYKKNISIRRIISYLSFAKQVQKIINEEVPELIYAIIPPNTLAYRLSKFKEKNKNVKLIFDIFDLYPEQMPRLSNSFFSNIWRKLRNNNLMKSDYVILECNYYKKVLEEYLDSENNSVLYLNRSKLETPYEFEWSETQVSIAYLGSINHHIDINKTINLLKNINIKKDVVLHIIGDGERAEYFNKRASEEGIKVIFYGKIFDDEKKKSILQKCQYGLNIYREGLGIGLTMKSIEYYQIGLPIINSGIYDSGAISVEHNSGFNIFENDVEDIANKIVNIDLEGWNALHSNTKNVFESYFSNEIYLFNMGKIIDFVLGKGE